MDRLGVVGVSWKNAELESLVPFTVEKEERGAFLQRVAHELGLGELWYLATCNRVEVAFVGAAGVPLTRYRKQLFEALTGRPPEPGEAERTLKAWVGEGAAEHLFLVAAGLESAKLGETEIIGQFREATELAQQQQLLGRRLRPVTQEALRVAARIRQQAPVHHRAGSLADHAVGWAREHLEHAPGPVALIGVSEMTERCGQLLARHGVDLFVVNRTESRAQELAQRVSAQTMSLKAFQTNPPAVSTVITAVGGQDILKAKHLRRLREASSEPPLLIDFGVPCNVDTELAREYGLSWRGMVDLIEEANAATDQMSHQVADARVIVDDALIRLRRRMTDLSVAPLIASVQHKYRETVLDGVARLLQKELSGLDQGQEKAVRRWGETLARRLAHLPSEGLREVAFQVGLEGVDAFLARSDAELSEAWRESDREKLQLPRLEELR